MNRPPLRITKYFFPKVDIEADPRFKGESAAPLRFNVSSSVRRIKGSIRKWQVGLDIESASPDPGAVNAYRFHLVVIGIFEVEDEVKEDMIPQVVQASGCSILYSAAREFLLGVTSRGPFPAVSLATMAIPPLPPESPMENPSGDEPPPPNPEPSPEKARRKRKK